MRPRGDSVSRPVTRKVGQAFRQSPQWTQVERSSSDGASGPLNVDGSRMSNTVESEPTSRPAVAALWLLQAGREGRWAVSGHDESMPSWERWSGAGSTGEHGRLLLIERAYDAFTIEHLERTGVKEGCRCLEVGAGAGSIA